MKLLRTVLLGATALALCFNVQADSKNKQNNSSGYSQEQGKNKGKSNKNDDDEQWQQQVENDRQRNYDKHYDEDQDTIFEIFQKNHGQYGQAKALPPGIQKKLARGKPLPPGIAKRFNPNVASQLPYYRGYEWQQVGTDAVLVNVTTAVVQEVLRGVLQ